MLLPTFQFHEPQSVPEILTLKAEYGEQAKILAGGTDLIVHLKQGLVSVKHVISIARVNELREIRNSAGVISIGCCVTITEISESDLIKTTLSAVKEGADNLASILVRNRATIGGNICNASPAADMIPSLLAYGTKVEIASASGTREMELKDFFTGPGKTDLKDDEVILYFKVPVPPEKSGCSYIQLGKRKSQEINIVNVGSFISLNGGGNIETARIALGSVGPTPLRALKAESVLIGNKPSTDLFAKAAVTAGTEDSSPIDDFRGSAQYRRAMTEVLTKRTLQRAYTGATA